MATCAGHHRQERASEEMRTFQEHFADLFEGIQEPVSLSSRLFSAGLLHRDTRITICSLERPVQQRTKLLDAVERQISLHPRNFYKFVDELEKDSPMQHLCDKLKSTCAQLKSHTMSSITLPANTSAHPQIKEHDTMLPLSSSSALSLQANTRRSTSLRFSLGSCFSCCKSYSPPPPPPPPPPSPPPPPPPPLPLFMSTSSPAATRTSITASSSFSPISTITPSSTNTASSSSTSSSSHSSTAVTRNQYRVVLKDCYRQPLPDDDKLLTTASKHYIELAVISREGITRKEADEFTKKSLHGLTEEILHKKSPIALKDILKPREDGKPVRCILVEGAPGIGKSTLAWEVCHKWEDLDSVKQYELVVLVRLREKKAQKACFLEDLLPYAATTNKKELLAAIGRGKGVLIVCDGFDELPHEQRQEGSVYIELLKGRLLPEATIIVTSRPSVSADLWRLCQHNIDRHLEVIGFTKRYIKRFAESVFIGNILEGFMSYITSNPPIYGMMYIPLNAVIVSLIYQDSYDADTPFPTTMTQLFDALTRALIRRHLLSLHDKICMPSSLQCIEDINKLPPLVAKQFLELAKVGYESLHRNWFVFTDLGDDFEGLGMMKKITSLNVFAGLDCECSYTFLHLTLQEYMAALYIAIECPSGIDRPMVESDTHNVLVRFLAGMFRGDKNHSHCYQELVKLLNDKIEFDALDKGSCSGSVNNGLLLLVHCVYECPSIMQSVNDGNLVGSSFLEPCVGFDWYVTGYCLSHFDVEWSLSTEHATDENIDLLVKGLRSTSTAKGKIHELHIHSSCKSLSHLKELCQLQALCLHDVSIDNDDEVLLCELIEHQSRLRRVECGHSLLNIGCTETGLGSFIPLLLGLSSLEELKIDSNDIIKINTELVPHGNTNLKKLTIQQEHIQLLATLLPNITSLIYLEIFGPVTDSDLSVLITTVQSLRMLEVLHLGVRYRDARPDLSELVVAAGNSRLKELKLNSCYYDKLPHHIQEQYKYLLKRTELHVFVID